MTKEILDEYYRPKVQDLLDMYNHFEDEDWKIATNESEHTLKIKEINTDDPEDPYFVISCESDWFEGFNLAALLTNLNLHRFGTFMQETEGHITLHVYMDDDRHPAFWFDLSTRVKLYKKDG